MRPSRVIAFSALLALASCAPEEAPEPGVTATPLTTLPPPTTTSIPPAPCSGPDFVEGGQVATLEGAGSDAQAIGLISWTSAGACETFTIGFESSEGAPATTPPRVVAAFLDPAPVLRLALDVSVSVVADQLVDTDLVDRLFVVNGLDGSLYLDVHLEGAAQARVSARESPAELTIELQPGVIGAPGAPMLGDGLVVVSPMGGATTASPVTISGYVREGQAQVLVIATSGDLVLGEHQLTPAAGSASWSEFSTTLALDPGAVTIFVGGQTPGSGGLQGVTVPITVGEAPDD